MLENILIRFKEREECTKNTLYDYFKLFILSCILVYTDHQTV